MNRNRIFSLLGVAGLTFGAGVLLATAQSNRAQPPCGELLAEFSVLGAEVVDLDKRLADKIIDMERASDDERLDAMQAVIEEMAEQRMEMRNYLKRTHQKMMVHLMEHVVVSGYEKSPDPFGTCPLVKYMQREEHVSGSDPNVPTNLDH